MATTKVIQHDGEIWVEQQILIQTIQANSRQEGTIYALEGEIKRLHAELDRINTFDVRLQVLLDETRRAAIPELGEGRLLIGYYEPTGQTFIRAASREIHPDLAKSHRIPVYVLPEP